MKNSDNDKINEIISKIKGIKNIKIILGLIIVAILILTYGSVKLKSESKNKEITTESHTTITSAEYTDEELKLADILSEIDGIGKTKVMICSGTEEQINGVIVVAEGADIPLVELQIKNAVSTALKLNFNSVKVYSMK